MLEDKLAIQPDKLRLEGERFAVECSVKKSSIITSTAGDNSGQLKFDRITKVIAVGNGEKISQSIKVGDTILIDQPHTPPIPYFSRETDSEKIGFIILDYYLLISKIAE